MDKAIMALKAQRFDEAQSAYEDILKGGYTVEAWCGLGACKMFQILYDGEKPNFTIEATMRTNLNCKA